MPLHEFDCPSHGKFEVLDSIHSEKPKEYAECPICKEHSPRDWLSTGSPPPSFHAYWTEAFKGGPHYIKDKEHEKVMLGDEFRRMK